MTGYEYEHAVAEYLSTHGYTNVEVTQASNDWGIDVTAHKDGNKYAVQCKYYSSSVGVSAVQEAVAGMTMYDCNVAMVVTNNTFTPAAQTLAKKNGVILLPNVTGSASRSKFSVFRLILWAVYLFVTLPFVAVTIEAVSKKVTPGNIFAVFFSLALATAPIWIKLLYRAVKNGISTAYLNRTKKPAQSKKHFFVAGKKKIPEDNLYKQTGNYYRELHNSSITGLPHKFTIEEETFNIDKIEDVKSFPLNFNSFEINGKEYQFNDYFRLCAEYYRKAGYDDLATALEDKAAEIEKAPLFGKFARKSGMTIITPPKSK